MAVMRFSEKENIRLGRRTYCAQAPRIPSTSPMVGHLTLTLTCLPCHQLTVFWPSIAMWWKRCVDKKDSLHNLSHAAAVHGLFPNSGASLHGSVTWAIYKAPFFFCQVVASTQTEYHTTDVWRGLVLTRSMSVKLLSVKLTYRCESMIWYRVPYPLKISFVRSLVRRDVDLSKFHL